MSDTRREFLKKAAFLSGTAALANVLPPSIQKALAINAPEGSTYLDAEHIVILMQENRSFDHCYGSLKGVRGFNDPRAIDLPNQNKVWLQTNAAGQTYAPFHLDIKNTKATWMHSLPHSWANQSNARNDGKYDKWLDFKRSGTPEYANMPLTLGYHKREDLPFYYSLADAFTVCDQNFCSSLTGTTPNRLFFWSGTVREEQHETSRANVWNEDADSAQLKWKTFPERLEENGIAWKCYQNEISVDTGLKSDEDFWLSNFGDNPLEYFAQYNVKLHQAHLTNITKRLAQLPAEIAQLENKINSLTEKDEQLPATKKLLKKKQAELDDLKKEAEVYNATAFEALSQQQKNIHLKAFDTNKNDPDYHDLTTLNYNDDGINRSLKVPKGDVLHQFKKDVNSGKLPTVSWLTAPESFSDHPSAPWYGAWYVSEVLDILTQNPEVWKKTIFILAYDENDGYFDHIPPFVAPDARNNNTGKVSAGIDTSVEFVTREQASARNGFPEKFEREGPIGLGYRVPLVIASPWSKGGWVNSQVFDHTSTLQFLEDFLSKKTGKNISEPNISQWRRTVCGNLTSVFRPYHSDGIPSPDFVTKDAFLETIHKAKFKKLPTTYQLFNKQEAEQFNANPSAFLKQESGVKPSNALPYQLHVNGKLSADKKTFEIAFDNRNEVFGSKTQGCPFNVYAPGNCLQPNQTFDAVRTWAYAVSAGDKLADSWPLHAFENDKYHLRVYGPNGFYREFTGNAADPDITIEVDYERSLTKNKLTGNVILKLTNTSNQHHTVLVTDNAYKTNKLQKALPPGHTETLVLNLSTSHNWYHFTVNITGTNAFSRQYAGRVETGKPGFTDPLMGNVI
ncbi:phospholipase C [Mucilaginibacter gracilis]|uniref:phospholipase C n=1 Tax=Mucilaginibacter gracilis TaxID=423350 RepID=A0A495IU86_9SPHI|nr:phospholipase C, phosphocholine-specific [Mucilaginibacter gracilis]RKR80305.1 phospholipase C [Mucilaginibacter gracilis]